MGGARAARSDEARGREMAQLRAARDWRTRWRRDFVLNIIKTKVRDLH